MADHKALPALRPLYHGKPLVKPAVKSAVKPAVKSPWLHASSLASRASAALLGLLWVLAVIGVLARIPALATLSAAGVLLFLVAALAFLGRLTLTIVAALLGSASVLALGYDRADLIWLGLERSTLFAAFLPTVALLRATLRGDARIERYRDRLEAVPADTRPFWIVSGGFVIASVLSVGSSAVLSSTLRDDAPEPERVAQARANVCGASLAIIWSPFFIAIAVVSDFVPSVPLATLIGTGIGVSLLGLALARGVYGRTLALRGGLEPIGALAGFALPIAGVTALVVAMRAATGLSTIETMLITLPVLCAITLLTRGQSKLGAATLDVWASMNRMREDVATVAAAMIFGTVLAATPWMEALGLARVLAPLPAPAVATVAIVAMAVFGFFGVQPLVVGTIWLIVLTGADFGLSDLATAIAVLAGWSMASMLSLSSLNVRVTAVLHGVRPAQLVLGRNLLFFLVFVPAVVAVVMLLNRM